MAFFQRLKAVYGYFSLSGYTLKKECTEELRFSGLRVTESPEFKALRFFKNFFLFNIVSLSLQTGTKFICSRNRTLSSPVEVPGQSCIKMVQFENLNSYLLFSLLLKIQSLDKVIV